jgi:DNA-binding winged helix-turn-helix (wHTH) protein
MDLFPTAFPEAPVREEDLLYIVGCLRQGECCSVVGPSNTGKSILLRSLLTEDVRQHCAQKGAGPPVPVFVDCLEAAPSEHAFYELLLRSILEALEPANAPEAIVDTLRSLHRELMDCTTDVAIRSLFARSIHALTRKSQTVLVVILDEFDDVFRALSPWPFRQLRALRDRYGAQLCYVLATSHHLERVRSDPDTYEFRELFQPYTHILCPLHRTDAERLVAYLARKQGDTPSPEHTDLVIELSGGHPGLTERIYGSLRPDISEVASPLQVMATELNQEWPIQKECRRLWDELEDEEHAGLLALVQGETLPPGTVHRQALEAKGLIVERGDGHLAVFSPVFAAFVQQESARHQPTTCRGLWYEADTRQIMLDGEDITRELSADQYALLVFLSQRPGVVCTKDEVAQAVWPDQSQEGITDDQIYQLVRRVREKVEPDPENPSYIATVRGQGYRLEKP